MATIEVATVEDVRRVVREELAAYEERQRAEAEAGAAAEPDMLSIAQVVERTGLSDATVRRQIKCGDLPAKRIGRQWRIPAAALHVASEEEVATLAREAFEPRRKLRPPH